MGGPLRIVIVSATSQLAKSDDATPPPSTQFAPPAEAKLTAGDPIKNASAILRYALPIDDKKPVRQMQVWPQLHCPLLMQRPAPPTHEGAMQGAWPCHSCMATAFTGLISVCCSQKELESIAAALRIPGSKSLGPVARVRVRDTGMMFCAPGPAFGDILPMLFRALAICLSMHSYPDAPFSSRYLISDPPVLAAVRSHSPRHPDPQS